MFSRSRDARGPTRHPLRPLPRLLILLSSRPTSDPTSYSPAREFRPRCSPTKSLGPMDGRKRSRTTGNEYGRQRTKGQSSARARWPSPWTLFFLFSQERKRERETRLLPFLFSPLRCSLRLNLPSHLGASSFVLLPSFIFLPLLPVRRIASSPTSSPLFSPRHRFLWRTHARFRYFRGHPAERLLIKLLDDGIERPTAVCVIERRPSRRFVADQMDKWSESVWMKRFFFLCLYRPQRAERIATF